ncbi:MAG: hypothetical protein WA364_04310 [Candidatus Nitrosopolaris sp.]
MPKEIYKLRERLMPTMRRMFKRLQLLIAHLGPPTILLSIPTLTTSRYCVVTAFVINPSTTVAERTIMPYLDHLSLINKEEMKSILD